MRAAHLNVLALRPFRLPTRPPRHDAIRTAVDRGRGNRQRRGERAQPLLRVLGESLAGQSPPNGADIRRSWRSERTAQGHDHARRLGRKTRRLARDNAAAAPADEADRDPRHVAERADLSDDGRQVRAGGPDIAPAIPAGRLIAEKLEVTADRDGGAVGRPQPRQDDDRLRRPRGAIARNGAPAMSRATLKKPRGSRARRNAEGGAISPASFAIAASLRPESARALAARATSFARLLDRRRRGSLLPRPLDGTRLSGRGFRDIRL